MAAKTSGMKTTRTRRRLTASQAQMLIAIRDTGKGPSEQESGGTVSTVSSLIRAGYVLGMYAGSPTITSAAEEALANYTQEGPR